MFSLIQRLVILFFVFIPINAHSVAIGDIKLHSSLNQNMDATINLVVFKGDNLSGLQARLASPDRFDKAGVEWNYFLTKMRFKTVVKSNGKAFVKVSSTEPLREPFLTFLVEVFWEGSSLYREFTVLVDPPADYSRDIYHPIPSKKEKAKVETETAPKPKKQTAKKKQEQTDDKKSEKKADEKKDEKNAKVSDGSYGPTDSTDFVWKIAAKTKRHDDISIEQMTMAIFKANPDAFYKDNVHALMVGQTLTIPAKKDILKLSKRDAAEALREQDEAWKNRFEDTEETEEKTRLAKTEFETSADTISERQDKRKNVKAQNLDSQNEALLAKLDKMLSRVDRLERQADIMREMLVLKDEKIMALQTQKAEETGKEPALEPELIKLSEAEARLESKLDLETEIEPESATFETDSTQKPSPKASKESVAHKEEGFNPVYLVLMITACLLIIVPSWFLWRRRRLQNQEPELDEDSENDRKVDVPDFLEEEKAVSSSFDDEEDDLKERRDKGFLPSVTEAFDEEEEELSDPLAEATVYMTYGRYQQAEALMRHMIEAHPEHDGYKLKLLEIFHQSDNKVAFEDYANELTAQGKQDEPEFWSQVVSLGQDLFGQSSDDVGDGEDAGFDEAGDETDDDFETVSVGENGIDVEMPLFEQDGKNDENLSIDGAGLEAESSENQHLAENIHSLPEHEIEFDVSAFEADDMEEDLSHHSEMDVDEEVGNEVEFDTSALETEESAAREEFGDAQAGNEIEFDGSLIEGEENSIADSDIGFDEEVAEADTEAGNEIEFSLDDEEGEVIDFSDFDSDDEEESSGSKAGKVDLSMEIEIDEELVRKIE